MFDENPDMISIHPVFYLKGNNFLMESLALIKYPEKFKQTLQKMLDTIESERSSVQIDLSEVEAIDTAGVQLLAVCRINALEKGKTFRITSESEPVREALKLTGLGSMLEDSNKA